MFIKYKMTEKLTLEDKCEFAVKRDNENVKIRGCESCNGYDRSCKFYYAHKHYITRDVEKRK